MNAAERPFIQLHRLDVVKQLLRAYREGFLAYDAKRVRELREELIILQSGEKPRVPT